MNYLDIIICVPLAWGLYKGFTKGFILEVSTLLSLFGAIWVAINFSDMITHLIQDKFGWKWHYLPVLSFLVLFIGVLFAVYALAKLVERSLDAASLGPVNKIAGALFGCFKFALILSIIFFMLDAFGESYGAVAPEVKSKSLLYKPVAQIAPLVIPGLRKSAVGTLVKDNKKAPDLNERLGELKDKIKEAAN
jgi:membrane protein required for colicin V production